VSSFGKSFGSIMLPMPRHFVNKKKLGRPYNFFIAFDFGYIKVGYIVTPYLSFKAKFPAA